MGKLSLFKYVDIHKDYRKNTRYYIKQALTVNDLSDYELHRLAIDINNLIWRYLHYNDVKCETKDDVIKILIKLLTPFMEKCRQVYIVLDGKMPYNKWKK